MTAEKDNYERFVAMLHKHRGTIELISKMFYPACDYSYREMVCDLTTFLWEVWCELPSDAVIYNERAWVYTLLYRKATNLMREEGRRQHHFDYDADLSEVVYDDGDDPLIRRMYRLIGRLDRKDRELVMMVIDRIPIRQIAHNKGKSPWNIYRRLEKIVGLLRQYNVVFDDEDDEYINDNNNDNEETT